MKSKLLLLSMVLVFSFISCDKENDLATETDNLILTLDAKKVANEHNRILGEIHGVQGKNSK